MEKEKKERIIHGIIASIIGGFILVIASTLMPIAQGVAIMVGDLLHSPIPIFWLVLSILFFALIFALIAKKVWIDLPKRYVPQSELDDKIEEYNELAKHVKLPKAVDKAITVEVSPKWGISHPHNDTIMYKSDDKFPYLKFYMRVINRTLYYFQPEEVVIGCSIGNHDIGTKKWSIKVRPQGTDIEPDSLHEVNDGGIWVRFPIKELYDDLRKWKLDGTVIYKLKGPVIEANKQYMRPEIGIHIEYELPEEQCKKLKEEVEKALGDER